MNIRRIILVLAMALTVVGAQAQSRRTHRASRPRTTQVKKHRPATDFKGSGASVYDLGSALPEDSAMGKGSATVSRDTVRHVSSSEPLVPTAEIDDKFFLQATASSPLDKVEICDATGKVLRSQGLHRGTKASIDLNDFPKDQTLVFKFYGVNGSTQNIELSH